MNLGDLRPELRELIARSLAGLDGHRDQSVLAGGLAKFFYHAHPDFFPPDLRPRATEDLDVALTASARNQAAAIHGRLTAARLVPFVVLDEAGHPIEQQYQRMEEGTSRRSPTCLEFLAPWEGTPRRRRRSDSNSIIPTELRYVELLLQQPVRVDVPEFGQILLPHPLSYIIQKTLIRSYRSEYKAAGDQADAFYVIFGFRPAWAGWLEQWTHLRARPAWKRWVGEARAMWKDLYSEATSTGSQEVAALNRGLAGAAIDTRTVARIMGDFMQILPED